MTKVADRLHHRLFEADKTILRTALMDYMMKHELDGADVDVDAYLIEELLPLMADQSAYWVGIPKLKEWPGSVAHTHVKEYLKNQLRNKGRYINLKIASAKMELASSLADVSVNDQTPGEKSAKSKSKLGKRDK